MIFSTWFDRPLSVAGKIVVREGNKFVSKLVNIDRDLVIIPNLAIHFNRNIMMDINTMLKTICCRCLEI